MSTSFVSKPCKQTFLLFKFLYSVAEKGKHKAETNKYYHGTVRFFNFEAENIDTCSIQNSDYKVREIKGLPWR